MGGGVGDALVVQKGTGEEDGVDDMEDSGSEDVVGDATDGVDNFKAALEVDRKALAWDDSDVQTHFYLHVRGGQALGEKKGRSSDGCSCSSSAHVKPWCVAHGWPRQPTFAWDEHTRLGATELAK